MSAVLMRLSQNWTAWIQTAALLLLSGWLYIGILKHLVQNWVADPNYSHAFLVAPFAVFLAWERRGSWLSKPIEPRWSGIVIVLGAMMLLLLGNLGAELFLSRISFIFLLAGLTVYFAGWQVAKSLAAPWLVLFLMVPLPVLIFNEIAFPLQTMASHLAGSMLTLAHVPAVREGNMIVLPSITLNIVEACSGIRSLMSLVTLAIFYGLLVEQRVWMRWALVLFAIPAAVAANALRIVGAALLGEYAGAQYASSFFHSFSGWLIFAITVGLMLGSHAVASRIAGRGVAT